MKRFEACHILNVTCDACVPRLEEILSALTSSAAIKRQLEECILDLSDSCARFADIGDDDELDDFMLPMFDALGYCQSALQLFGRFGIRTHLLASVRIEAQNALDELEEARSGAIPF